MSFLANLLALLGASTANIGTQGCPAWFIDEPKMPNCLLNK